MAKKRGQKSQISIYSGTSLQGILRDWPNFSHRLKFPYSQYRNEYEKKLMGPQIISLIAEFPLPDGSLGARFHCI